MQTSDQINELATALAKAQGQMAGAIKDTKNPFFNHNYADLASVKEAIRKPFADNGLSVIQFPQTAYSGTPEAYEWTSKRSGEVRYGVRVFCSVTVVTRLLHTSGQWVEDTVSAMLPNADPQSVGSAITYLRRYALQSVAGVAPEDDDGEAAQGRGNNAQTQATAPPVGPRTVSAPPKGYIDWLDDLKSASDEGTERLQKAWRESSQEYRAYLTGTTPKVWEGIKAHAAQVTEPLHA